MDHTQLPGGLRDITYALDQSAIVAATDVKGAITYVNDKFCEISQYAAAELLGQNHRLINSGYHPREFFVQLYRTIASGRVWRGDVRNRAKDGSIYWVDTTIVPFMNAAGAPIQYVSIRYDITARKQTERLLREQTGLVQMGRMAAVVAHEVRNPLAGIRGAMQVLAQRLPESPEIIQQIIQRIDTLNDIVQDLLVFAHPRPLSLGRVAAGGFLAEVVSLLSDDPRLAGVAIDVTSSDAELTLDAGQMKLALLNLLLNAGQAQPGGGTIRVECRTRAEGTEIRVVDAGPGIPEHIRDQLFEPFFTTKSRGTGLGLVTARRIVELHGGTLSIESPPSGGTVAKITLPPSSP